MFGKNHQLYDLQKKISHLSDNMSDNNSELYDLRKQLQIHEYRTSILYFQSIAKRLNSRSQFLLNCKGEFHLNDCLWSFKNTPTGPDNCCCRSALCFPDRFFENKMMSHSKHISILRELKPKTSSTVYKPLGKEDESLNDFYQFWVLDSENIYKWYEMYKSKLNVLKFQIKVRELKKKNFIDAIYNSESGEWHLTDCISCSKWDLGSDTCHCQLAMVNPWKYLKEVYNFIDWEQIIEEMRNEKVPVNFKL